MVDIIRKKRDGQKLSASEIENFICGVKKGIVPDYQISALLMAIYLQGMDFEETAEMTRWMIETGEKFELSTIGSPRIDKHSTGGVGDKISLILAPLAAELGIYVPMISGRGLGHTGGTVDKLESIPGYETDLSYNDFMDVLKKNRCSIISQTDSIAPVDRELYALRDVTSTVESIPLITSSILSKKLSEDLEGLVIDLKVGSGAFMKDISTARTLGKMMKEVGERMGTNIKIVFTDQSSPIGRNVGNAPEVIESINVLKGKYIEGTSEITTTLVKEMCKLADINTEPEKILESGRVFSRFQSMVEMHGGNLSELSTYSSPYEIKSKESGIIQSIDAYTIGVATVRIGAGREKKEDEVDSRAGVELLKIEGDEVKRGETITLVYAEEIDKSISEYILSAYTIGSNDKERGERILEIW